MELKIIEERENPLLDRVEIEAEVISKDPVKREQVKEKIAALKNAKEDLIIVDRIEHRRNQKFTFIKIYKDEKALRKIELKHKVKKNEKGEENEAQSSEGQ